MYYDLTEFLDSLKGLTRESAAEIIQEELDLLSEYHQKLKSNKTANQRTFTREYNFLKNLLYEIKSFEKSNAKSHDREVINEVLQNLKTGSIRIIKATKKNE